MTQKAPVPERTWLQDLIRGFITLSLPIAAWQLFDDWRAAGHLDRWKVIDRVVLMPLYAYLSAAISRLIRGTDWNR